MRTLSDTFLTLRPCNSNNPNWLGLNPSLGQIIIISITATAASIGAAGIPHAGQIEQNREGEIRGRHREAERDRKRDRERQRNTEKEIEKYRKRDREIQKER